MEVHARLYGSMKMISQHTSFLAYRLYQGMASLSHFNGTPVCIIYNDCPDRSVYGDHLTQGGTVAFNIIRADGSHIGHATVEDKANKSSIYLRSGGR
jgi:molybdenum cofactor sulfurtransferase